MNVYAVRYNPCAHESGHETLSLHKTRETAKQEMERQKANRLKQSGRGTLPAWELYDVLMVTVRP